MTRLTRRAEEALLGAALFRPEQLGAMRWIPPGALSRPDHQALWQVLHSIDFSRVSRNDIPAAVSAAVAQLPDPGIRQCLSPARLAALAQACPSPRNMALYGGMALEAAVHRSVEETGLQLRQSAREAETDQAAQALEHLECTGNRLAALDSAWKGAPETVRNLLDTPAEEPVRLAGRASRARTDVQAEAETVSSLLWRPAQMPEVTGWLAPGDFSDPQLAATYQAMTTLADRHAPIDALTVAWEAARRPGPQPSEQVLADLESNGMSGAAAYTGERVLATAALDRMDVAGHDLRNLARHPQLAPTSLIHHAGQAMEPAAADRDRLHHAQRDPELAPADKEPAPPGPTVQREVPAPDHEMEI